jgi:2-oxoisovalerate dehydrogenase E1 component alpha subunit
MIVANNRYGISTPFAGQHAYDQIAERGRAFHIQTAVVDGNDPEASYTALKQAIEYVRTERKPYLVEAMVSRLRGHSSASGANPADGEVDCLERFERVLDERKLLTRSQADKLREQYNNELLEAARLIRDEPHPGAETIWDHVFADKNLAGGDV